MKSPIIILTGLVAALLMGWSLGYLRIPFGGVGSEFWLGALAMLGLGSILGIVIPALRKQQEVPTKGPWLYAGIIGVVLVIGFIFTWVQKANLEQKVLSLQEVNRLQQDKFQRSQNEQQLNRVHEILKRANNEVEDNSDRQLSSTIIEQIIQLSQTLKPYQVQGPEDSVRSVSPERGFLLSSLLALKMDTLSWSRILSKASFQGADLRDASLPYAELSNAQLQGADLSFAVMDGANLNYADLSHANLKGSKLRKAKLNKANLHKAQFQWAQLQASSIQESNLGGANFSQANLGSANLKASLCKWSFWEGAILGGAILEKVDFLGAKLTKADLSGTDLSWASLSRAELRDANLRNAKLDHLAIHLEDWTHKLSEWQVEGNQEIEKLYKVVEMTSVQSRYRLQREE